MIKTDIAKKVGVERRERKGSTVEGEWKNFNEKFLLTKVTHHVFSSPPSVYLKCQLLLEFLHLFFLAERKNE
jgi:hypothetical protein